MADLPTLREVTRQLRELNEAWQSNNAGAEYAALTRHGNGSWTVEHLDSLFFAEQYGRELVPAAARFDAVGAARRLLAEAREALRG